MKSLWCGKCPKCLFVFVLLAAFIDKDQLIRIFGQNLLGINNLERQYQELLGIRKHKPFDCVGTPEEAKLAFFLAFKKGGYEADPIMKMFEETFGSDFASIDKSRASLLSSAQENNIPEEFKLIASQA
jgi:hypothetical protein